MMVVEKVGRWRRRGWWLVRWWSKGVETGVAAATVAVMVEIWVAEVLLVDHACCR